MVGRLVVLAASACLAFLAASPASAQRGGDFIIIDDDFTEEKPPQPVIPPKPKPPRLAPPVWKTLSTFKTLDEFNAYRVRARDVAKSWGWTWGFLRQRQNEGPLFAQATPEPCDPAIQDCGEGVEEAVVTGMRASSKGNSITNNQEAGVDEGDIVKAFDRFLVVLMHGRLFSIDTGSAAGQLELVDRVDAYDDPKTESWIDEVLIFKDTLLVTGYSYETSSSNISLFKIHADGHFSFLARYSIESNDYFDWQNYATRIVDGKLVIYTPYNLSEYPADQIMSLPRIRRFTEKERFSEWRPLFNIQDVYRPIQPVVYPGLHVMSVCPIDPGAELRCRSRGIVGPWQHEMYVAPDHAYLWLTSDSDEAEYGATRKVCEPGRSTFNERGVPSAVFRLTVSTGALGAVHTEGWPMDQFSMEEKPAHFWALVRRPPLGCEAEDEHGNDYMPMALANIAEDEFSTRPPRLRGSDLVEVPYIQDYWGQQTRFADRHVLYGVSTWDDDSADELIVVPLRDPRQAKKLSLRHNVDRLELFGDNAVVFGQKDDEALAVSSIKLTSRPQIVDTQVMPGIAESEGRSHAFNSMTQHDGSGIFGLPTYDNVAAQRSRWEDVRTEVRFFTASRDLKLLSADQLNGRPESEVTTSGYDCVVSCYDWYGNSRPIFFRDRVFALIGAELIEGSLTGGRVAETARVNLTGPPAYRR